jgi:hypothetical protein
MLTAATAASTVTTPFMFTVATIIVVVASAVTIEDTPITMTVIVGTAAMADVHLMATTEEEILVMDHHAIKDGTFS